jgi:hypothetical protein
MDRISNHSPLYSADKPRLENAKQTSPSVDHTIHTTNESGRAFSCEAETYAEISRPKIRIVCGRGTPECGSLPRKYNGVSWIAVRAVKTAITL